MRCARAKETRKMRLETAPATARFGTATRRITTISAVVRIAVTGVFLVRCRSPTKCGRLRSLAMVSATREAASRLACRADSMERMAATMTSQKPNGPM